MKASAWLLSTVLLAGCSANVHLHSQLAPPPAPPGGHAAGASVSVGVHGSSLAALIVAGLLLGAAVESFRGERPANAPLAPDRLVNEQDCGRSIADPYANLKCR